MKDYNELTLRGRARRLRTMALQALERYNLDIRIVRLVTNESNGIFRVDTVDGEKYMLRITDPIGCHDIQETRAELSWLNALHRDTDLRVPEPLTNRDGEFITIVEVQGVPEPRPCVVFRWVPGVDLEQRLTRENFSKLGALAAQLHIHAETYTPPHEFHLRTSDTVFYYSNPDFAYIEPLVLFDDEHRALFEQDGYEVYVQAYERAQTALETLYRDTKGLRVIHNDLHYWNVKIHRGKLYALDFEDLVRGYPVQDIATTLFYIQDHEQFEVLTEAFERGYCQYAAWPVQYPGQLERFIISRGLMLANYVVNSDLHEHREMARNYLARVETRLRKLLVAIESME